MPNFTQTIFPQDLNLMDIVPYQFGYEKCSPSHSFGPAVRSHYLFHYVISGRGTLWEGEHDGDAKGLSICAGQGFMIFPGIVCTYIADGKQPWEYTWLEFDGLRAREISNSARLNETHPVWKTGDKDSCAEVKSQLLYLAQHGDEPPLRLVGHIYLFAAALAAPFDSAVSFQAAEDASSMRSFYARETMAFVERNYNNNIGVEDMASNCRLNRSYFARVFHEEVGMDPQEYLINYRMTQAEGLLRSTNKSIGEVAAAVGYRDQLSFSRAFRRTRGLPPSQWRMKADGAK